jgi:hypothetical protein
MAQKMLYTVPKSLQTHSVLYDRGYVIRENKDIEKMCPILSQMNTHSFCEKLLHICSVANA